jgi:molybdopterin-guanine dinucleotide biosynthesis protein A
MVTAGFVLAGGASSRMRRNKAFLTLQGKSLIEIISGAVNQAAGNVTIIGSPQIYAHLNVPVIPDFRPNAGPLAGIETALLHSSADWNLIVACDMPRLTSRTLQTLLDAALANPDAGAILPESHSGHPEPLCAVYHRRLLPAITRALDAGIRKVTHGLPEPAVHYICMAGDPAFQNVNTPEEWSLASQPE